MRLLHPVRLGVLLVVLAVATLGVLAVTKSTQATLVVNEYSMEVNIAATSDAVGGATFVVQVGIVHGGVTDPVNCFDGLVNGIDDDGDTVIDNPEEAGLGLPFADPPFGCYAGAQWNLEYDQTMVDLLPLGSTTSPSIVKVGAAPAECNLKYDDGDRALMACANTSPPPNAALAYTGPAWNLTFDCTGTVTGTAVFTLKTTGGNLTLVNDGNFDLPIHTHNNSIDCTGAGPAATNTPLPTATPTPFPTTTPTRTPTNTVTPCDPAGCPTATPTATVHPRNTNTPVATTTSTAPANMFAINPSVCLALQGAAGFAQCYAFAYPNSIAIGQNRAALLANIDDLLGDADRQIERSELVDFATFTGTHIHTIDGSLAIVAFVGGDDPVKFETTAGTFFIDPFTKGDEFVCGTSFGSTLIGDEDCDHDGLAGDGVIFAQLLGNGEPIGTKGTVTAYNTITGEVIGDFFFEVVGEAQTISLDAVETTVGGALPDTNGDTVVNYADCPLPGDTAGFLAAIDDPNRTAIFGRVHDKTGQNIIGSWVEWSVDNPALGVLAAPQTPTLNFGSFGFGAPQVFCGIGGAGTVKVRGKIITGPLGLTFDPIIQPTEFELEITLVGEPAPTGTVTPTATVRPVPSCSGGNNGFESGIVDTNILPCWLVADSGFGSWCAQTGSVPPQGTCQGIGVSVPPPPELQQAAMTNQSGPGSHVLYKCGTLASGAINFELYLNNRAGAFFSPDTLDFIGQPNQQFRADLVTAASVSANPFSVASADVLMSLYRTQPGDALVSGYTLVSGDASAFVGEQACLRFAEVDNQLFFHAGVDDVHIDLSDASTPTPTATNTATPTATNTAVPPTSTPTHTPTTTPTPTFTPTTGCFGDVNGDGKVTGRDVAAVARALGRQDNPDANVNHDGKVSLLDLTLVIKAMHASAC